MTEALGVVVPCGHRECRLNRIEAWTLPGNIASERVLEKTGFQYEGTLRQRAWFKEAFHALSSLEALHVFYSANDKIIRLYSRVANLSFPRFGATGPADVNKLPSYAVMHDVTAALGVSDVHNRYVTRDGAAVINLGKMLEYP